jgi:hypothetical protein
VKQVATVLTAAQSERHNTEESTEREVLKGKHTLILRDICPALVAFSSAENVERDESSEALLGTQERSKIASCMMWRPSSWLDCEGRMAAPSDWVFK